MAYYNRKELLYNTLQTIEKSYLNKEKFEIIIVDDASNADNGLGYQLLMDFKLPIKIIKVYEENKNWVNGCVAFNKGFKAAKGDIIIFQNPECLHTDDILSYVNKNFKPESNEYWSFAAYSFDSDTQYEHDNNPNFKLKPNNRSVSYDGDNAWYNHSLYRPVAYHFCSVISRDNLIKLNGFDERFANGNGYDDNELLTRIRRMNLKVKIVDLPFVVHQFHYGAGSSATYRAKPVPSNFSLFQEILNETSYKAAKGFSEHD